LSKYRPQELRSELRWLRRAEFREQFCFRVRPLHRFRMTIEGLDHGIGHLMPFRLIPALAAVDSAALAVR